MKLVFTKQAIESLDEACTYLIEIREIPLKKVLLLRNKVLDRAEGLVKFPNQGQEEEYLEHLNKSHRRLVEGNFKIIYKIEGNVIVMTDFFDTRQNPEKMKG